MAQQTQTTASGTPPLQPFAVFLSHNSLEKPVVKRIAEKLKQAELEPWLDTWCLTPGGDWQNELAQGLQESTACAVFVGPNGIGNWEDLEYKLATDRMAKDRAFRLFLVLLPGLPEPFDASTLPPFLSIRTWVDLRRGIEDARSFQSLINAIKGLPLGPERPIEPRNDICPYRGLQTFDEEHTEFFFGRDADIQRLIEKLKTTRFVAVVGPSGSGKSSLVRAGVIPALKSGVLPDSDTWKFRVFTPGARPLAALAANLLRLYPGDAMNQTLDQMSADERTLHLAVSLALAEKRSGERVVWVVDQFEEVFTLCQDQQEREQFISNLLYAASIPDGRNVVVLTLRADFYPKCAAYPELSARIAAQQFLVSPMGAEALRQAIEEPAWHVGLEFEQGLVETILDDVEHQPGALPLLEHALLELWERRRGMMMTLEAYRESGGVEGAIAKRADTIYATFSPEQQEIARRIMLRLTQPGEGTEDTRRRASMGELVTRTDEIGDVEDVVRTMTDARLLMTDTDEQSGEQITDVSHEALIRSWPRLRKWIEEDRAGLRILRRLTEAAREWQPTKDESLLYHGARLAQAVEWRERNEATLNELEREFLDASVAAQQAVERRRKRVIIGLAAGFVIALALAALAVVQWRRANEQTKIALSKALAAQSLTQIENDPDLAFLLGIEANRVEDSLEARSILLVDLQYREHLAAFLHGHTAQVHKVAFSPDGKLLASASGANGKDNTVRLWNVDSNQPVGQPLIGHQGAVLCVSFSPDGKFLASGDDSGVIILWDVATMSPAGQPLVGHQWQVLTLAFSPDGKMLASGSNSRDGEEHTVPRKEIYLWEVASHNRIGALPVDQTGYMYSLAFNPDGKILAAAGTDFESSPDHLITLWDVAKRQPLGSPLKGHEAEVSSLAFSPDGRVLASGSADKTVKLWDVAAREPIRRSEILNNVDDPHTSEVLDVRFSPDSQTLTSVDSKNHVLFRQLIFAPDRDKVVFSDKVVKQSLTGYFREMGSIAFSPDLSRWATGGCRKGEANNVCTEGEVSLWNVATRLPISRALNENFANTTALAFSPDGKTLAVGGKGSLPRLNVMGRPEAEPRRGEVHLWDVATGQPVGQPFKASYVLVTSLAYSPDGKILASSGCSKLGIVSCERVEIHLWNPSTQQLISEPLTGHGRFVNTLVFSPNGKILASSDGEKIIFWDVETRRQLGEIVTTYHFTIAFSPDGRMLASGGCGKSEQEADNVATKCLEGEIRFWDVTTRQLIGQPLGGHKDIITSIAFSPDGKSLASASNNFDETVHFWNVAEPSSARRSFKGQINNVKKVVFSPDGQTLILASNGSSLGTHNLFLLDVATLRLIGQPLAAHDSNILDIALSPDGRMLASGGENSVVKLLDLSLEAWLAKACRIANRNLTRAEWKLYIPDQPYQKTCTDLPEPSE